jgi:hypothetical protein
LPLLSAPPAYRAAVGMLPRAQGVGLAFAGHG